MPFDRRLDNALSNVWLKFHASTVNIKRPTKLSPPRALMPRRLERQLVAQ